MKLYRGENADVWARRLQLRGWPKDLAERVASFAVSGDVREVPKWDEISQAVLNPLVADLKR